MEALKSLKPRISVAPMMDWTTKDYRFFARLFNPNVVLYTEMVTTGAIIYGGANRHLDFNQQEHPIVLQLGGSNPQELATCTKMAEDWGYNEVNLNVGCPSDRVQNNKIGACLMAEPNLVAECMTKCVPYLIGCCKYGVAKQLSIIKIRLCFLAMLHKISK